MARSFKERLKAAFPVWRDIFRRNTPFVRSTIITGAAAGALTVADINAADELVSVLDITTPSDLSSEFTVTGDGVIDNTGGTATTGLSLIVTWLAWDAS